MKIIYIKIKNFKSISELEITTLKMHLSLSVRTIQVKPP